ncbi:MAG: hypothetical protein EBW87_02130 [Burkholderiaceae bacterium]|nr:hypothetical protein [Burkholderiaceae bacterium]
MKTFEEVKTQFPDLDSYTQDVHIIVCDALKVSNNSEALRAVRATLTYPSLKVAKRVCEFILDGELTVKNDTFTREQVLQMLVTIQVGLGTSGTTFIEKIKGDTYGEKAETIIKAYEAIQGTESSVLSVIHKLSTSKG